MKETKSYKKINSNLLIMIIIGSLLVLVGLILTLVDKKKLDGRDLAIGEIINVYEQKVNTSLGTNTVTMYDITYNPYLEGEIVYSRQKEPKENYDVGNKIAIYFSTYNYKDIYEYKRINSLYPLCWMTGICMVLIATIFIMRNNQREKIEEFEQQAKDEEKKKFKIDDILREKITNETRTMEQTEDNKQKIETKEKTKEREIERHQEEKELEKQDINTGSLVGDFGIKPYSID